MLSRWCTVRLFFFFTLKTISLWEQWEKNQSSKLQRSFVNVEIWILGTLKIFLRQFMRFCCYNASNLSYIVLLYSGLREEKRPFSSFSLPTKTYFNNSMPPLWCFFNKPMLPNTLLRKSVTMNFILTLKTNCGSETNVRYQIIPSFLALGFIPSGLRIL